MALNNYNIYIVGLVTFKVTNRKIFLQGPLLTTEETTESYFC